MRAWIFASIAFACCSPLACSFVLFGDDRAESYFGPDAGSVRDATLPPPDTGPADSGARDADPADVGRDADPPDLASPDAEPADAEPWFVRREANIAVGLAPSRPRIVDLDGDRDNDVIVANYGSDDVSILRQLTPGVFRQERIVVEDQPIDLEPGDFDGNGTLDIAVLHEVCDHCVGLNALAIVRNDNGPWAIDEHYSLGDTPRQMAAGDLDRDGADDIVVANFWGGNLSVFYPRDGVSCPRSSFDPGGGPGTIEIADVSGDGIPDILVVVFGIGPPDSGAVSIFVGQPGRCNFAPAQHIVGGGVGSDVDVGDLDGDPHLDFAFVASDRLYLFAGTGTTATPRLFEPLQSPFEVIAGNGAIKVGRLARSGLAFMAITNQPSGDGMIAIVGRTSSTASYREIERHDVGDGLFAEAIGDLNQDGKDDIAVLMSHADMLAIFYQR